MKRKRILRIILIFIVIIIVISYILLRYFSKDKNYFPKEQVIIQIKKPNIEVIENGSTE